MTTLSKPRKLRVALWADHDDSGKSHPGRRMTEEEFVEWCDELTHAEWVNGAVIVMSPANINHIAINTWLTQIIFAFVDHHDLGVVMGPQAHLRLANVVSRREPDILFVSRTRKHILRETYIDGPPDLVIEIGSPESTARDWRDKHAEDATGGIKEYWIIDPKTRKCEASATHAGQEVSPDRADGWPDRVVGPQGLLPQAELAVAAHAAQGFRDRARAGFAVACVPITSFSANCPQFS